MDSKDFFVLLAQLLPALSGEEREGVCRGASWEWIEVQTKKGGGRHMCPFTLPLLVSPWCPVLTPLLLRPLLD